MRDGYISARWRLASMQRELERPRTDAVNQLRYEPLCASFRAFIANEQFPCVGAKSAAATGGLDILVANDLREGENDDVILHALRRANRKADLDRRGFQSLAVLFEQPGVVDEAVFERLLWQRLQSLADRDTAMGCTRDPLVSASPDNPDFAVSFGGKAYFVVGLHPGASRPARRFSHAALVFNRHDQFVALREQGQYERMREQIIKRDIALAGTANPMLARHGDHSAARQYSGRNTRSDWTCPFRDSRP
jgi:hypothetical protein